MSTDYTTIIKFLLPTIFAVIFIICRILVNQHGTIGSFQIFQGDYRNMYPYIDEPQVTSEELDIICLIPLFIAIIISLVTVILPECSFVKIWCGSEDESLYSYLFKVYFNLSIIYLCLTCTMMFTEIIKNVVAMPRPNFMGMCDYKQFDFNYTFYLENIVPGELVNLNDCYANLHDIQDSISSFPSGHSSYTSSIFFSSYLIFQKFKKNNLQILLFGLGFLSLYVGISRIVDYYHNVWDVLFGYFLSAFVNILIFSFCEIHYKKSIDVINPYQTINDNQI